MDVESNIFNKAVGAYVNVIGYSKTDVLFKEKLVIAALNLGLNLIDIEDLKPLDIRITKFEVDNMVLDLVKDLQVNDEIKFSRFHTYPIVS